MKQVLSLLMAFVFLQTQTWALSGGPFGSTAAGGTLTGSYAGVLVPQVAALGGSASIGLFTLAQPDSGLTTGTVSVFVNGAAFTGTISGFMDPKDGAFSGIIDATSTFTVSVPVTVSNIVNGTPVTTTSIQQFPLTAQGSISAQVDSATQPTLFFTATAAFRIEGTASLDIFFRNDPTTGTPIISQTALFDVDGFKQAD